uniref:Chorismate mutase domain-containing protein n=1 Tax=Lotharella globosa TaxID=91324 RepID=A0A7S3ZA88_9EUKA
MSVGPFPHGIWWSFCVLAIEGRDGVHINDLGEYKTLLGLIRRRTEVQKKIARAKFALGIRVTAIQDENQERKVLHRVRRLASENGLEEAEAVRFQKAQMDIGKQIQRYCIRENVGMIEGDVDEMQLFELRDVIKELDEKTFIELRMLRKVSSSPLEEWPFISSIWSQGMCLNTCRALLHCTSRLVKADHRKNR